MKWGAENYHMKGMGTRGRFAEFVREIGVTFKHNGALSKEEILVIYYECVEELLNRVNSDEQIRPFLLNYPFSKENISIEMSFYPEEGYGDLPEGEIAHLFSSGKRLCFYTYIEETGISKKMYEEPYKFPINHQLIIKNSDRK